jgi:hypothetical protein
LRAAAGIGLGTTIKYLRGAAGIGLGTTIKYLRRSTSGAAGNGLSTTAKNLRGAAGIGLGTTIKYLRRKTRAREGTGPRPTYTIAGTISDELPCIVEAFVVNSEPDPGARPSVRLCVGPELARCVHRGPC